PVNSKPPAVKRMLLISVLLQITQVHEWLGIFG
ncbi:MAG: hypothetical protein ACI9W2_004053, partial [Gammaproteobacteria bacterium]